MKQSANTEHVDREPAVPGQGLLTVLLPFTILLAPQLMLAVRALVHPAFTQLARTLSNHLRDLLQRAGLVGDRHGDVACP